MGTVSQSDPAGLTVPVAIQRAPAAAAAGASPAPASMLLAGAHFAAATLFLVAGSIGLVWIAPDLAIGAYPAPHVAGITHLFTLGWLTLTIFGALYQLLPVALAAPLRSIRVGYVSFATFAPGAALFAAGVATSSTMLHHAGIALVTTGMLLVLGNVGGSLMRARTRDVTWQAVVIALAFLASTLVLGVVLLHNIHTGFLAEARVRVLAAHLHIAIVGWALVMMVGVSHRLLPMFLIAHGADSRWTRRSIGLLAGGVLTLATGLSVSVAAAEWAGALLVECGIACFLWQAYSFYRVRARRNVDVGMRFAGTALGFLIVSAVLGPFVLAGGVSHQRLATAYVAIGLLGGIVLYVVGFFYKIVPLLAWTIRYRDRRGKDPIPTVAEMFSARVASLQLAFMASGVTLLASGIGAARVQATRWGALLFLIGVILFVTQVVRVGLGGRCDRVLARFWRR